MTVVKLWTEQPLHDRAPPRTEGPRGAHRDQAHQQQTPIQQGFAGRVRAASLDPQHLLLGNKRNRILLALTNNLPVIRFKVSVPGYSIFRILAYWFGYWFA